MSMMLPGGGFAPDPRGKSFGGQPTGIAGGGFGGFGGKPPIGRPRGIDMDQRPGQPMQGGFNPQRGSQQGGGQPMGVQQAYQQFMNQQPQGGMPIQDVFSPQQQQMQQQGQGALQGGQPMQGGFNPYQQLSQLAGSLGGGGGQFGGQPMQGGFNPQQQNVDPFAPTQEELARNTALYNSRPPQQATNFTSSGGYNPNTGQFTPPRTMQIVQQPGQPMQGGFNSQQRQIQDYGNAAQGQGGQFGGPLMPQAPTTQQGQPPMPFKKGGFAVKPVWDKKRPKDLGKPEDLSVKKKKSAKARAKAAGRPYPNLIDNMAAARKKGK